MLRQIQGHLTYIRVSTYGTFEYQSTISLLKLVIIEVELRLASVGHAIILSIARQVAPSDWLRSEQ